MKHLIRISINFIKDEQGATAIEYGIIALAVSFTIAVASTEIGAVLSTFYGEILVALLGS